MCIRMIVSDLDGTIFKWGDPLLELTIAAVGRLTRAGKLFTLASGRMPGSLTPFAHRLGANAPLICYGGALIYDPSTDSDIYQRTIPIEVSSTVLHEAKRRGLAVNVYRRDELLIESLDESSPAYRSWLRSGARAVGDLTEFLDPEPLHLAIICDESQKYALTEELRAMFAGQANVSSGHPNMVEFNQVGVSKGRALEWLSARMSIDRSQVLTIGNDLNDLEMLKWSGVALAVSDSPEELLSVADEIVPAGTDVVRYAMKRFDLAG